MELEHGQFSQIMLNERPKHHRSRGMNENNEMFDFKPWMFSQQLSKKRRDSKLQMLKNYLKIR